MIDHIDGIDTSCSLGGVLFEHIQSKFTNVKIISSDKNNSNTIDFGYRSILNGLTIHFKGSRNKLIIGKHCRIVGRLVFDGDDLEIKIDSNTSFEDVNLLASESSSIEIGADCMFSYGIEIRSSDSHGIFDLNSKNRVNLSSDIKIGNHVWIGMGVSVLPGGNIADGCVIGAKAVVASSLDQKCSVYVGVPAKKVRDGIVWSRYKGEEFPEDVVQRFGFYD